MYYVLHNDKPYFCELGEYKGNTITKFYPVKIDAMTSFIDRDNQILEKFKIDCTYTLDEIRHRLGIKLIDDIDENGNIVKVSNITVSSLIKDKEPKKTTKTSTRKRKEEKVVSEEKVEE